MNAIINAGSLLVPFAVSLSSEMQQAKASMSTTTVEILVGMGTNGESGDFGGAFPAISIWNAQGARLGQYMPKKNRKIKAGTSDVATVYENEGAAGQPEYLQLTTVNNDAICVTHVVASGNGVSWTWLGDIGYTCGGDWYPSTSKDGTDNYQPKCIWIDADHSDGLHHIAMSMHMPDFNGDSALSDEYDAHKDNLCDSKARFMLWGQLPVNPGYNSIPPMFKPALQYADNGTDKDFKALFKPGRVNKRDIQPITNSTGNSDGSINRPGHVVISDYKAHCAEDVCNSKTSRGPSFVSTQDGMYCDMSTKTIHPLCSSAVKYGCFDINTQELIGPNRRRPRDLKAREVQKQYSTHERWVPSQ